MKKKIFINEKHWHKIKTNKTEIFYKGFDSRKNINAILSILSQKKNVKSLLAYAKTLKNNFAIIIKRNNNIYAITDKIRAFPLLYFFDGKKFFLFENYSQTKNLDFKKEIDNDQVLFFSLSGYTHDQYTLYKNVKQINQATLLSYVDNKISLFNYHFFNKSKIYQNTNLEKKLKNINEKIILKLINSCKGKFIVVPLSAGYDSRFILSGIKEFGFKDIIAFSYGRVKNREVEIAKALTKEMKIPWHYVAYTNDKLKYIMESEEHKKYEDYADNLTSIHFPQDFWAIKYLNNNNIIPKNSVIVNGQTGDFISGNHLPKINYTRKNIEKIIIRYYISKHYKLWQKYYDKNKIALFNFFYSSLDIKNKNFYKVYEKLEFENRQCKYVINGQRLYEFFNYEWRLPMWDDLYLNFWGRVPLQEKINQKLYKKALHNTDWCGVWNNIPINPKSSFPGYIHMTRLFLKAFFIFKGKASWHAFEKKYLNYFIDPLCGYAQWEYSKIIKDNRIFRNSISWQTEKYLNNKKIDWEKII